MQACFKMCIRWLFKHIVCVIRRRFWIRYCCRHVLIGNDLKVLYSVTECTYRFAYSYTIVKLPDFASSWMTACYLDDLNFEITVRWLLAFSVAGHARSPGVTADQLTIRGPPWLKGGHGHTQTDTTDTHDTHVTHVTLTHDMPPENFIKSTKAHNLGSEMQSWVVLQLCYCYH